MDIILFLLELTLALDLAFLLRTLHVSHYRSKKIKKVHELNVRDIDAGRPWYYRWELWDQVSFNEMVFKFWRDLDSFMPEGMLE